MRPPWPLAPCATSFASATPTPTSSSDDEEAFGDRDRDVRCVVSIAHGCLRQRAALTSPFGVYLEGAPGPLESSLRLERKRPFTEAADALAAQYRHVFRHALALLFPDAPKRQFPGRMLWSAA